jgi:hypothetical protein
MTLWGHSLIAAIVPVRTKEVLMGNHPALRAGRARRADRGELPRYFGAFACSQAYT